MQGKLVKSGFAVSALLVFNLFGTAVPETNSLSPLNQIQARLEISKNVFPASGDCELSLQFAKNCPDPLYTTFILTYTVGADTVFKASGGISISLAYRYNGEYRTEREYTHHLGWSPPRFRNRLAANYTTAAVEDNPFGPVHPSFHRGKNRKLMVRFDEPVGPGARILITFGDRSQGSPGFLLPTLPLDIDLVVEEDTENNGLFRAVKASMPTLRVTGTRLDRFVVVAPSTPEDRNFKITVNAMQGADAIDASMFLVQNYPGTIRFFSTDPTALLPEDYTFTPEDGGSRSFRVSLPGKGTHTIGVREIGTSKSGTSNPVQLGEHDYSLFWGVLHQHTNISGHGIQTPQFAFEYGRDVADLDFLALTEHCGKNHFDWKYSSQVADDYNQPGQFVTFNGYEWGHERYGHRHVIFLDAIQEECYCQKSAHNPTTRFARTLEDLFLALEGREALIIPHHTAWKKNPKTRVVLGRNSIQKLFEIYSKHGSSEKFDNAPYPIHGNLQFQMESGNAFFQNAIAEGVKFGVTSGTDDHYGMPGGQIEYNLFPELVNPYRRKGLTGVYAKLLTREGIWDALNSRRTYGTTGARIILDFRVNNRLMGEDIISTGPPKIGLGVAGTASIEKIFVIRNGNRVIHESSPKSAFVDFSFVDTDVVPGREYSYYVRIEQKDLHIAWSSPIWVTIEKE